MMPLCRPIILLTLLFISSLPGTAGAGTRLNVNPIRRVVTMLQMMQKKVEAEGKKEAELFENFMCYCKNGVGKLNEQIKDADTKVTQLESSIPETEASLKQLSSDITKAKANRKEAQDTIKTSTELRHKEEKAFTKFSTDAKANIAAMKKAVVAIEKGMAGSFLQTQSAVIVNKLALSMDLSDADRAVLTSFISSGQKGSTSEEYAPSSGEVVGILKQMEETMSEELTEVVAKESQAVKDFDGLVAAKERESATLTKEIDSKEIRSGRAGVELTNQKDDLADTSKSLANDKKFLVDLSKNCDTKEAEKEANDKMRAEELLALSQSIKILNDDESLSLFKKTLPQNSFLQVEFSTKALKKSALKALSRHAHHGKRDARLNLISLALRGKKTNFDDVIKMIDAMIGLLGKEQKSDTDKKTYCETNIAGTEDDFKGLQSDIEDSGKSIADGKESIKAVSAELADLTQSIKDLDQQVAEATKQRKDEHAAFEKDFASDSAATELLGIAKNRLAKFYDPNLYKPDPSRTLNQAEQITVNMGGTLAPTAAPSGIAGTGVTAAFSQYESEADDEDQDGSIGFLQVRASSRHRRAAPPPPPGTAGAYQKSQEASQGVMSMLDVLMNELKKEMVTAETNDKEAQKEYEEFIKDSAQKRSADAKSLSDKEGNKVELEATTLKTAQEKKGMTIESMAKMKTLENLHGECDWLLENFEFRKKARAGEVEQLNAAKSVLSGADYSL